MSLKVKSISHAYIYLEYYFGPQCLHMPTIEHLAYCQRCNFKGKCQCSTQCTINNCKCHCHHNPKFNSPYHSIFCPSLNMMLATILKLTKLTSILLPHTRHKFKWSLITSDLANFGRQSMKSLWFNIYSIYIQIMYRTHYKPYNSPLCYQSEFLTKFIHQLKVSHIKMIKDIKMNSISNNSAKDIENNKQLIISSFCNTWTHPYISTLNEDNTLTIHIRHKETTDDLFTTCLNEINSLIAEDHPYHTANH